MLDWNSNCCCCSCASISCSFYFFHSFPRSMFSFLSHSLTQIIGVECKGKWNRNELNMLHISPSNVYNHGFLQEKRCKIEFIHNLFVNEWSLWFTVIYDCIKITDQRTVKSMSEWVYLRLQWNVWMNVYVLFWIRCERVQR